MLVAGFMSGSGTNLLKILECQTARELGKSGPASFRVSVIFTDNAQSRAAAIGQRFGIPVLTNDIMAFYRARGRKDKRDLSLRPEYDRQTLALLAGFKIDAVALAGYMSIVTPILLDAFPGRIINVHPADLTVRDGDRRRYTGDRAVMKAIQHGEKALYATTHLVREAVDYGEILMVSAPVPVVLPAGLTAEELAKPEQHTALRRIAEAHQDRLKEKGDWIIFPRTLELIATGRFGLNERGEICLDGTPVPLGYRE